MKTASMIATGCMAGLASFAALPLASAANIAGALSAGDPTYNRNTSGCGSLSGIGTAVHYDVFNLSVSVTGGFDLSLTADPVFDPFIAIYNGAFNPASATTNCLGSDDDNGPGLDSFLNNLALNSATSYLVVVTSFANGETGAYNLAVVADQANTSGPQINLAPAGVPEPASLALLGLGLAGLGFSRRKS